MMYRKADCEYPLLAVSFNHRAEAFYQAFSQSPDMPTVAGVSEKGLSRVAVLHYGTSERVVSKLVKLMNQYHGGSGDSFLDYMEESLQLEASWKSHCKANRITTHNPKYLALQQEYVLSLAVF